MSTQHTPGPWVYGANINGQWVIDTPGNDFPLYIAKITDSTNAQANARLIAAAPLMLEMLKILSGTFEKLSKIGFSPEIDRAHAITSAYINSIISKATTS